MTNRPDRLTLDPDAVSCFAEDLFTIVLPDSTTFRVHCAVSLLDFPPDQVTDEMRSMPEGAIKLLESFMRGLAAHATRDMVTEETSHEMEAHRETDDDRDLQEIEDGNRQRHRGGSPGSGKVAPPGGHKNG